MIKIIVLLVLLVVCIALFLFLFPYIEVCGDSMYPTYKDGEIVHSTRLFRKSQLKIGDVVLYNTKRVTGDKKLVIKRIADIKEVDDKVYFYCLGDNSENSYDSKYYGYVPDYCLRGKLVKKYQRKQS